MNYNEIAFLAKRKGVTLSQLAKEIGITPPGLRKGVENGTLPEKNIVSLCRVLEVSPNEVLGWNDVSAGNYASNIGGSNQQNAGEAITALHEQLREKDRLIDRLMAIVEKGVK